MWKADWLKAQHVKLIVHSRAGRVSVKVRVLPFTPRTPHLPCAFTLTHTTKLSHCVYRAGRIFIKPRTFLKFCALKLLPMRLTNGARARYPISNQSRIKVNNDSVKHSERYNILKSLILKTVQGSTIMRAEWQQANLIWWVDGIARRG